MSQKAVVLAMLREAGSKGVSAHELVYRRGITRAAAIIHDLRHNDGWDIDTVPGKPLPDGRMELASYVLRNARRTEAPRPPAGLFDDLPTAPAVPLQFECGCVRATDGKSWAIRCEEHQPTVEPTHGLNIPW